MSNCVLCGRPWTTGGCGCQRNENVEPGSIIQPFVEQGWVCPVCGRGMAPHMPWCDCSNEKVIGTGKAGTGRKNC